MKHQLTHDERRKGGWTRARQHAVERRLNPSRLEKKVQSRLLKAGYAVMPEVEIFTDFPQWIDIVAFNQEVIVAIEVDGSHGWHGYNGKYGKMAKYDEMKARWCNQHNIPLVYVNSKLDVLEAISDYESIESNEIDGPGGYYDKGAR